MGQTTGERGALRLSACEDTHFLLSSGQQFHEIGQFVAIGEL